jgi:hypothetical protein
MELPTSSTIAFWSSGVRGGKGIKEWCSFSFLPLQAKIPNFNLLAT